MENDSWNGLIIIPMERWFCMLIMVRGLTQESSVKFSEKWA